MKVLAIFQPSNIVQSLLLVFLFTTTFAQDSSEGTCPDFEPTHEFKEVLACQQVFEVWCKIKKFKNEKKKKSKF